MSDQRKAESAKSTGALPGAVTALVAAAAFVILVAGMKAAQAIIVPFLLAVFIAIIMAPAFIWMRQRRVPSVVALVVMITVVVGVGVGLIALISKSVADFSAKLPQYREQLELKTHQMTGWLNEHSIETPERLLGDSLDPGAAMGFVGSLVGSLSGLISNSFLILLTVIFLLLEMSIFEQKLRALPGMSTGEGDRYGQIVEKVRHYVGIKSMVSVLTAVLIWIWLVVLGVDYAALWALLAFFLNFVPNIGSIIAAVPAVILALVEQGVGTAIWTGVGYLVVNTIVGNIIEPRVMGKGLGLSVLVVFLSLIFWGWVLGPIGMILSVPLTMTVKIVLEADEGTRWIAVLLGSGPPPEPAGRSGTSAA